MHRRESLAIVPDVAIPDGDPVHLPVLLVDAFGVGSRSEARRLISQGGVKLNGEPVVDIDVPRARLAGAVFQVGKRRARLGSGLTGTRVAILLRPSDRGVESAVT